jgi:hypothetical protein
LSDDDDILFESAKILQNANVANSLFMDTSSTPNLGGYSDYSDLDDNPLKTRNTMESNQFSVI